MICLTVVHVVFRAKYCFFSPNDSRKILANSMPTIFVRIKMTPSVESVLHASTILVVIFWPRHQTGRPYVNSCRFMSTLHACKRHKDGLCISSKLKVQIFQAILNFDDVCGKKSIIIKASSYSL